MAIDTSMETAIRIRPQEGAQMAFLSTPADLALYGGAAFGGKTYALLIEPLRNLHNGKFSCVMFRRTQEDITKTGGLWDTSCLIYPQVGGIGSQSELEWKFPSGMKITFRGMKDEKDRFSWQGAQIPLICWDEATHFTQNQVFYMMSRNRSDSGIPGYMRFTCNPDPDSFIRELIDWYISPEGYPIPERSGKVRWFIRRGFNLVWSDSKQELINNYGADEEPKSLTFIPAKIRDNPLGMKSDPGYLSNLKALSYVDRMQLLEGNWNVRAVAGSYFKREWFKFVDEVPKAGIVDSVRFFDRASTERNDNNDPDQTVGVKMSRTGDGLFYIEDARMMFATPRAVEKAILACAEMDGVSTRIGWMQDPGSAGVMESQDLAAKLAGYTFEFEPSSKAKTTRAKPVSSQCEAGNIRIVRGAWNEAFLRDLEGFPDAPHDDAVDALSGAFNMLSNGGPPPMHLTARPHDYSERSGFGRRSSGITI